MVEDCKASIHCTDPIIRSEDPDFLYGRETASLACDGQHLPGLKSRKYVEVNSF